MQAAEERAVQNRRDEEIQVRLKATLGGSREGSPGAAPPLSERPMSPPRGAAPRIALPPPGIEPDEFKVASAPDHTLLM